MGDRTDDLAVSVVGLGKLGACTATALASRGIDVIGVDLDERTIELVNAGHAPVDEPGLEELVAGNRERLRATPSHEYAVLHSDITLILVPTPSTESGGFSLEYVRQAAVKIGQAIAIKPSYHLVVLVSTVLPGASEAEVIPLLEHYSGKQCGRDFGFCYGPEFIALGRVVRDFLNPDFVLIGEFDKRSGDRLTEMYRRSCTNGASIVRLNIVNAELTKLAVNTYVTTKISFANMLTQICSRLSGADVDEVTSAMGHDRRIGARYLKGAVSYGGPCFPRDNLALAHLARTLDANANLAEATHDYNLAHNQWLLDQVCSLAAPGSTVAVIGLTYRPGTTVLEEAAGMWVAQELVLEGRQVVVYDKRAAGPGMRAMGDTVSYAASLQDAVSGADVVILMSPEDEIASLRAENFESLTGRQVAVVDCWRACDQSVAVAAHISYVGLGLGPRAPAPSSSTEVAS